MKLHPFLTLNSVWTCAPKFAHLGQSIARPKPQQGLATLLQVWQTFWLIRVLLVAARYVYSRATLLLLPNGNGLWHCRQNFGFNFCLFHSSGCGCGGDCHVKCLQTKLYAKPTKTQWETVAVAVAVAVWLSVVCFCSVSCYCFVVAAILHWVAGLHVQLTSSIPSRAGLRS